MATLKNVAIYYFVKMNYLAKIYFITIISFLISQVDLLSQRESYNWFVGHNSGISFKEKGERLVEFKTKAKGFFSCGSISDKDGNLLVYANHSLILNFLHDTLAKTDNTRLDDNLSLVLIVPRPNHIHQYYIFQALDAKLYMSSAGFIRYSLLEINERNKKGKFLEKEVNLTGGISDQLKLSAV